MRENLLISTVKPNMTYEVLLRSESYSLLNMIMHKIVIQTQKPTRLLKRITVVIMSFCNINNYHHLCKDDNDYSNINDTHDDNNTNNNDNNGSNVTDINQMEMIIMIRTLTIMLIIVILISMKITI